MSAMPPTSFRRFDVQSARTGTISPTSGNDWSAYNRPTTDPGRPQLSCWRSAATTATQLTDASRDGNRAITVTGAPANHHRSRPHQREPAGTSGNQRCATASCL